MSPVACLKPSRRRGPFALVHRLVKDFEVNTGKEGRELIEPFARAVLRTVIYADNLARASRWQRCAHDQADQLLNRRLLVVDRDDDGDFCLDDFGSAGHALVNGRDLGWFGL